MSGAHTVPSHFTHTPCLRGGLGQVLPYLLLSTLLPLEDSGPSWKKSLQEKEDMIGAFLMELIPNAVWSCALAKGAWATSSISVCIYKKTLQTIGA